VDTWTLLKAFPPQDIRNVLLTGTFGNDNDAVVAVALGEAMRHVIENLIKRKVDLRYKERNIVTSVWKVVSGLSRGTITDPCWLPITTQIVH
jgi:hypothetical protein